MVHAKLVTEWLTLTIGEVAMLLAIRFANSPEELVEGRIFQIQFALSAKESMILGEQLVRQSQRLLDPPDKGQLKN